MGGVRRHNSELLPRVAADLAKEGGRLAILTGRNPLELDSTYEFELLPSDVPAGPPLARARKEARALRDALERAAWEGRPFDLVHTGHLPAPTQLSVPYTLTLHDLRRLHSWPGRWFARPIIARGIERAVGVITVSETVRDEIQQSFHPRRTWVVSNAADHLRLEARSSPDPPFLLHVGHVEPRKNLGLLLRALAVEAALPNLLLVGAPKAREAERLRALARRLGVEQRVTFAGPVPETELPRLYATCACAVFPSRIEGFGIGVLEAMRAGAPIAIARAGALEEIAGPDAPNFAPNDPPECVRALRQALRRTAADRDRLMERASSFSWSRSSSRLLSIWREVAAHQTG